MNPALVIAAVLYFMVLQTSGWAQKRQSNPEFAHAQIQVQVRLSSGSLAPRGVMMTLEQEGGGIVGQVQADDMGRATFHPPLAGTYVVTAKLPGFDEVTQRVDLNTSPTAYVVMTLRARSGLGPAVAPEGPAAGIAAVPPNAMKEFEQAQTLLEEKKDIGSGVRHLQKAIELYKPFSQAYMLLGLVYLDQHNWQDAQKTFDQAVHVDPNSASNHLGLGAAYNGQKNFEAAEKELKRGLEINPDAVEGEYELAKTCWATGKWEDAQSHAEKALSLRPDFASAHVLLGNVLLRKGDTNGALNQFKEYLKIDPQGPMAEQTRMLVAKIEKALASAK
jgi:Flp pilus assembly protein TadD